MRKIKYLLILTILLIPILVKANNCELDKVSIKAVTIKKQSDKAEEIEKAALDNNQVNLNIKFQEEGDYISYNVFMQNNTNEDYEFYTDKFNINSDYIAYEIASTDPVIKAGEGKIIEIKASYKKAVEDEKFESGIFQDNKAINLKLLNDDKITNPETGINHTIFSVLCIFLGCFIIWKTIKDPESQKEIAILLFISTIIIPITANASCQYNMEINSNVTIEQIKKVCVIEGIGQCNSRIEGEYIRKREITEKEFYTYLENTNSINMDHDFIRTEDFKRNIEIKVPNNQILDSSIGCYIFSSFKKCN